MGGFLISVTRVTVRSSYLVRDITDRGIGVDFVARHRHFLVVSFSFGRWHRGGGFLDFCHLMDSFIGFLDFGSRHSFVEQT